MEYTCTCWRRWLPRRKLDPLGVSAEVDGIKLTANNKANVCAAVQRAYDRARQETAAISRHVTSPAAAAAASGTEHVVPSCDDTSWHFHTRWHNCCHKGTMAHAEGGLPPPNDCVLVHVSVLKSVHTQCCYSAILLVILQSLFSVTNIVTPAMKIRGCFAWAVHRCGSGSLLAMSRCFYSWPFNGHWWL